MDSGDRDVLGTLDTTPPLLPWPGKGLRALATEAEGKATHTFQDATEV